MTDRYGQLANFTLKVTDLLLLLAALGLAILINYAPNAPLSVSAYALDFFHTRIKVGNALLGGVLMLTWYLTFYLQGLYRSHRLTGLRAELAEVARAIFFSTLALMSIAQIGQWRTITIRTAACVGFFAFFLIGGVRLLVRLNLRRLRLRGHNLKKLVIIGTGSGAPGVAQPASHSRGPRA